MRILLLWFAHIANVDLGRNIWSVWTFFSWFFSFAYHLVVIVEAEEALEVLPICLNYIM